MSIVHHEIERDVEQTKTVEEKIRILDMEGVYEPSDSYFLIQKFVDGQKQEEIPIEKEHLPQLIVGLESLYNV